MRLFWQPILSSKKWSFYQTTPVEEKESKLHCTAEDQSVWSKANDKIDTIDKIDKHLWHKVDWDTTFHKQASVSGVNAPHGLAHYVWSTGSKEYSGDSGSCANMYASAHLS